MTTYRQRLDRGDYQQDAATTTAEPEPDTQAGAYHCPDCNRTFTNEHGLNIHRTKTHGTGGDQ